MKEPYKYRVVMHHVPLSGLDSNHVFELVDADRPVTQGSLYSAPTISELKEKITQEIRLLQAFLTAFDHPLFVVKPARFEQLNAFPAGEGLKET